MSHEPLTFRCDRCRNVLPDHPETKAYRIFYTWPLLELCPVCARVDDAELAVIAKAKKASITEELMILDDLEKRSPSNDQDYLNRQARNRLDRVDIETDGGFMCRDSDSVTPLVRTFTGGATRDTNEGKLAFHRFLSPRVLQKDCEYLQKHRRQSDGQVREPDNWKNGIPQDVYTESLIRHMFEAWTQFERTGAFEIDTLCAIRFNTSGYIYEEIEKNDSTRIPSRPGASETEQPADGPASCDPHQAAGASALRTPAAEPDDLPTD